MPHFMATIRKSMGGYRFVNGYLLEAASLDLAFTFAPALVSGERNMHGDDVVFETLRVAGYKTADPNDFKIEPLTGTGDRIISGTQYAPPFVAVHMRLTSASGRPGKRFYRYCLQHAEVYGIADQARLSVAAAEISDWEATWALVLEEAAGANVKLLMGDPTGPAGARQVSAFTVAGAAQLDVHHGWYNRQEGS